MTRGSQAVTGWIIAALAATLALPGLAQAQATKPTVSHRRGGQPHAGVGDAARQGDAQRRADDLRCSSTA